MKITTNEGEFELIEFSGDVPEESTSEETTLKPTRLYALKPVKKTEDKEEYKLEIWPLESAEIIYSEILDLTPTTANKLSEAISALVKEVTGDSVYNTPSPSLVRAIRAVKESFEESQ